MSDDKTPTPGNKQTIATVSALVLGVAGSLGWIKPPDNTAAIEAYGKTKAAIEALEVQHDAEMSLRDKLDARRWEWIAGKLRELDRDRMPYDDDDGGHSSATPEFDPDEAAHYTPPAAPPRHEIDRPPRPSSKLPPADEFIE